MSTAYTWAFPELRKYEAKYLDSVTKNANFGGAPLEWIWVYAYLTALSAIHDTGLFNPFDPMDAKTMEAWTEDMARAFGQGALCQDEVFGNLSYVCRCWLANNDAARANCARLNGTPEVLEWKHALETMHLRGGVLYSRHHGILQVKSLHRPLEFVRTPDVDLRAAYQTWSAFTAAQQRDERALGKAYPQLPDHTLNCLFKTLSRFESDVRRQVTIIPFD